MYINTIIKMLEQDCYNRKLCCDCGSEEECSECYTNYVLTLSKQVKETIDKHADLLNKMLEDCKEELK